MKLSNKATSLHWQWENLVTLNTKGIYNFKFESNELRRHNKTQEIGEEIYITYK